MVFQGKNMIQVIIVEDDRDFIYLIETRLAGECDIQVIGSYEKEITGQLPEEFFKADLVIMDLNLSGGREGKETGIRMAKKIRSQTDAKILILTGYEEPETILWAGRQTFASGYLLKKNYQGLSFMIRSILAGNAPEEIYICSALLRKLSHAERYVLMEYLGYEVVRLKRVRIMNLTLKGLKKGDYREITKQELKELERLLKDSDSRPWKERR